MESSYGELDAPMESPLAPLLTTLVCPPPLPDPQVLPKALRGKLAGVLFDLGISSPQLDDPARGMRPEQSGPLDLRFDIGSGAWHSRVYCVAAAGVHSRSHDEEDTHE